MAVALVDIDHFKAVNDVFGHLAGDDVLARTADSIVGCVRSTDLVGRFGGDEFCALLFCAGHDDALATAERIRRRIAQLSFIDPRLAISASVGLATAPVAEAGVGGVLDLAELMAAADRALYRAKHDGRNRVVTPSRSWSTPAVMTIAPTSPTIQRPNRGVSRVAARSSSPAPSLPRPSIRVRAA